MVDTNVIDNTFGFLDEIILCFLITRSRCNGLQLAEYLQ
jgi:hypothetical protein